MTFVDAGAPMRAPGVELLGELQDSGYAESRSIVRRADGQIVQLTPLLYQLVELVDGSRTVDDIADALSDRTGRNVSVDNVISLLEKLEPLGVLATGDGSAPQHPKPIPLLALRWKVVVSDPEATRRITSPFAVLFKSAIVVPTLIAFVAVTWWVLFRHGLASGTRQAFDSPSLLLGAFLLMVLSAGWHEFGHAAACFASGARPGAMGAGLYIVWPAFYTDVDDCRRLSRWGRLKVDLGGLYFNALAAVVLAGVWFVSRVDTLLLVVAAQLLLMLRQLAPVIRADGYHILSDLVGVPDLFQHVKPTLLGLLPTNWGKPQPLRRRARWIVRAWVLIVLPLLAWLFLGAVLVFPRLLATAANGLAQQASSMSQSFSRGDVVGVLAGLLQTVALVLPVAAVSYMLVRLVRRTVTKMWRATSGRPAGRAGVVALLGGILVLLMWLWWPSGQYQPVAADERGTLPQLMQRTSFTRAATPDRSSATPETLAARGRWSDQPIDGVVPATGYALVPRDDSLPALLLVENAEGELMSVITDGPHRGYAFPFELPDAPGIGDNQALAVNDKDGTVVYDVAVALVWVTEDGRVTNTNEAYALASCRNCTTVAVAFQVVAVIGHQDVVAPINIAVAANDSCLSCQTAALAVQLVVTLREMPSEKLQAQIEAALRRLEGLDLTQDVYTQVKTVEREILTLLVDAGLVEGLDTTTSADSTTATSTTLKSSTSTSTTSPAGSVQSTSTTSTTTRTQDAGASTSSSTTTSTTSTTTPSTTTSSAP
ncbi:MAG TPA: hypothetical protein VM345_15490 [Acidimicrobiales bacterium]|jgi:putative peptide zinc metalloprotease protein|nr:hypothetical protein [Acidimicrobiales bacterium]